MRTKRFTILHSNDMHGDFLAEVGGAEGNLIGGLGLLSGYVSKVRQEEENVLYVIAGDMLQGSTIEIMNYLAPDVVTLGNHEVDYGLPHLLFLEKMANFPIVNANLYISKYNRRLMRPFTVLNVAGFDIMFIGIITEAVLQSLKMDEQIATFISLEEASREVGKICNAYKGEDIDLTVLQNTFNIFEPGLIGLLQFLLPSVLPSLAGSLGTFPLPDFLGLQLDLVEVSKNGAFMSLFVNLTPVP